MSRRQWSRSEVRWTWGCCLLPVGLFFAVVVVVSAALFNALSLGGGLGEGMLYGLAVVGGMGYLLYAVYKRNNRS